MKTVTVNTPKPYEVIVDSGILPRCGELIAQKAEPCRAAIITDEAVNVLYAQTVERSLMEAGFTPFKLLVPRGEANKSLVTAEAVIEQLAENHITRADIIIALGGGAVNDIAGFAASIYLCGVKFFQIPTTFLAVIDSSVGGRTSVNLSSGKGLAQAVLTPELAICDIDTLKTLPSEYFSDGVGEALKYGMAFDRSLFELLRFEDIDARLEDITTRCIEIKAQAIAEKASQNGTHGGLSFGHTVGHAIELCSKFTISHGHAVAIGMAVITRACVKKGLTRPEALEDLLDAMRRCDLPAGCGYTARQLVNAAISDKKRMGEKISLIIPVAVGETASKLIDFSDLEQWIAQGL